MDSQEKEIQVLQKEATTLQQQVEGFKIKNDKQLIEADEYVVQLKKGLKRFKDFFEPIVSTALAAHRAATAARAEVCGPIEKAAKQLSEQIATYKYNEQKKIEERERKAREDAAKKEEKKKKDLEDKAKAAEKSGDHEGAADLREKKEDVYVQPRAVKSVVKTNTATRVIWEIDTITNKARVPENYKLVDEAKLKRAKNTDPELEVPGVKFRKSIVGAVRTK